LEYWYKDNGAQYITYASCPVKSRVNYYFPQEIELIFPANMDMNHIKPGQHFTLCYRLSRDTKNSLHSTEYGGIWKKGNPPNTFPPTHSPAYLIKSFYGEVEIVAPFLPGEYQYRIVYVGVETVTLKEISFVVTEMPLVVQAQAQPEKQHTPIFPMLENIPQITIPEYPTWEDFFTECDGIDASSASKYTAILDGHNIPVSLLKSFDFIFLTSIGIISPIHQLLIMDKVNEIKSAEMKHFIVSFLMGQENIEEC